MAAPRVRSPLVRLLYNHNPFYVVSAGLMIYGVRAAYGTLEIGAIDCWWMMGVLAGYTLLLATIGVLIVRWGKVWEDARSILLVLLLLFLGVSISADDLFVKASSPFEGRLLLIFGYLFSAIVTEGVLFATGVRLGLRYRGPYHLLLGLFFAAPWWCSPELHPRSKESLEWALLLFPTIAGGLFLTLLPAVRKGAGYVADNGTPWKWPLFPWIAFGVIAVAVTLRSYALCLTYGPSGPIWRQTLSGGRSIAFDTIWGPYFLVPFALAILVLLLEAGLKTGHRRLTRWALTASSALLLLPLLSVGGSVHRGFVQTIAETVGSPLWITMWLVCGFHAFAALRRVPGAGSGAIAMLALASLVGPRTIDLNGLTAPQGLPFAAIATALLVCGLWRRKSAWLAGAAASAAFAAWLLLPQTDWAGYRLTTCYHGLWLSLLLVGLAFRDPFAQSLRLVGAAQAPISALVALLAERSADVPVEWRVGYVLGLAAVCLAIGTMWRSPWYLYAFAGTLAIGGYFGTLLGYRWAAEQIGKAAIAAFAWSAGTLLLGLLISAHKANWLPRRPLPDWGNGGGPPAEPPAPPLDYSIDPPS